MTNKIPQQIEIGITHGDRIEKRTAFPYSYLGIQTTYKFRVKQGKEIHTLCFGYGSIVKKKEDQTIDGVEYTLLTLARLGGRSDEFTVVMPSADATQMLTEFEEWKKTQTPPEIGDMK